LTTKIKEKYFYHKIHFLEKEQCVMLAQFRLLEGRRLTDKMGKLSKKQFDEIREALKSMIGGGFTQPPFRGVACA
jgi:hypothetical protein